MSAPRDGRLARVRTARLRASTGVQGPNVKALADFVEVARAAGVREGTPVHITHDPNGWVTSFQAIDVEPVDEEAQS